MVLLQSDTFFFASKNQKKILNLLSAAHATYSPKTTIFLVMKSSSSKVDTRHLYSPESSVVGFGMQSARCMVALWSEARWLRSNLPLIMPRSCGFCPGIHWYTGLGLLLKYHLTTRPENLSPAISAGFSVYSQSSNAADPELFRTADGTRRSVIWMPTAPGQTGQNSVN